MSVMLAVAMVLTSTFIWMKHPMSAGVTLMGQALMISVISGMMSNNFWYSYILFMIMIGGLLVLFIYMTSVASNEKFNFSYKPLLAMMIMMSIWFTIKNQIHLNLDNKSMEMIMFNSTEWFQMSMSKYLNNPMSYWTMFMIMYLLMALIAVVKITDISYGPLRQSN